MFEKTADISLIQMILQNSTLLQIVFGARNSAAMAVDLRTHEAAMRKACKEVIIWIDFNLTFTPPI